MDTLTHYRITRKLGEGGMGVVYEAFDDRLGRAVALKTLRVDRDLPGAQDRLWREARSLARVNHPNVCQIFDAEQDRDTLFLVLELLEGESLAQRLERGPLPPAEVVSLGRQIAGALDALHRLAIVHRDLKPSNVFLTKHGVKLLDFGLASQRTPEVASEATATQLTSPGAILGTPRYMAPEQARGLECTPSSDIFAAGCVLYEMLAGKPAFSGSSVIDVLYSLLHHEPPPAGESEALDRIVRRALAKDPHGRWPSATALEAALAAAESTTAHIEAPAHPVRRLIVLPFRILRPDDEAAFLAQSLPDAITNSLAGLDNLVIRSSMVAARFGADVDPGKVATEAHVDAILSGSVLRGGGRVRITCQLADAPSGAVSWSHTADASMQDLFTVQDQLAGRIANSLLPSLTGREQRQFGRDVPRSAAAYEHFLRANQLMWARGVDHARTARELYRECLALDPQFAPAWAALGRVLRFLHKFGNEGETTIESVAEAFGRAFDLNPDLALAHNLYTPIQCDLGQAPEAMERLLRRARFRRHDADLFAGLTQACRYAGELQASIAAHDRAAALDPHVATSVAHTWFLCGEFARALESYSRGAAYYLDCAALACMGQENEALARLLQRIAPQGVVSPLMDSLRAYLQGDMAGCVRSAETAEVLSRKDPESLFYLARHLARAGEPERALGMLTMVIGGGFLCDTALDRDPWFESVRGLPGFVELRRGLGERRAEVHARFLAAGGAEVL